MEIEVALNAQARIGESPTWIPAESSLYWIDIKQPALHRFHPESKECKTWVVSSDLGAFALIDHGSALVALRDGIHRLNLLTGALALLAPAPFDPKLFRFNEGLCDRAGRFWVGVMFDPLEKQPSRQKGSLHSFTLKGGLRRENDEAELHNGMALSEDGRRFFVSHSFAGSIYSFDIDPSSRGLRSRRLFATIAPSIGLPDGAAIDAAGGYWCAVHGGSRLRRYTADGALDREVMLPVSKPTMCAFAGDDLDILYVTSASDGMSEVARRAEPLAGALLRFRPGVKGVPRGSSVR